MAEAAAPRSTYIVVHCAYKTDAVQFKRAYVRVHGRRYTRTHCPGLRKAGRVGLGRGPTGVACVALLRR